MSILPALKALVLFTLVLMLTFLNNQAIACSYYHNDIPGRFADHDNVFAITVTSVELVDYSPNTGQNKQHAKFKVEEVFKGSPDDYDFIVAPLTFVPYWYDGELYARTSCDGAGLYPGSTYIVFADKGEQLVFTLTGGNVIYSSYHRIKLRELSSHKTHASSN